MNKWMSTVVITAASMAVIGCSGGDGSSSSGVATGVEATGTFVDSAVEGLDYQSSATGFVGYQDPRGFSGKTNAAGEYKFNGGDKVRFLLGSLVLGETTGSVLPISPADLFQDDPASSQKVVNVARILQSLDADRDPGNGITILPESVEALTTLVGCAEGEECTVDLPSYDTLALTTLLSEVVETTDADDKVVSEDSALAHLLVTLGDSAMIRKNISKTAELHSSKPKMNIMTIYVDAQAADGTPVYTDETNTTRARFHPIVSTYADSVEGAEFIWDGVTPAHDTFAAISLDDGATWKRINLSRTATRSSFKLKNGKDYPGDSHKPVMQTRGNNILVVWDDKFCRSGNPLGLEATVDGVVIPDVTEYDGNVTYADDIYLVNGSQDSVDYATISVNGEYPYTDVGEVPYGCVMASRTVINPDAETPEEVITTYVAEQITTGRRDALQIFLASSPDNAGFGFTWQEDPEGLRPGSGKGPGAGWGGATTNHKTDIWYSYMLTSNFDAIDEDFVSSGDVDQDQIVTDAEDTEEEVTTRPHALNKFALPVRISNNAVCSEESVLAGTGAKYCAAMCDKYGVYNNSADAEDPANGKCYGPGIDPITGEKFVLDGDTGASRPNIFIQPGKFNGESRAIAIFGYEETKGLGDGAPEDSGIPTEGSSDTNWTDTGKYVIYESFPFDQPEVLGDAADLDHAVSGGHILNVPNESEGIYENARRIRFIPQGMKSMETAEEDIVLAAVYKEGMEGQGRPSDIMLARWKGGYGIEKVVEGRINISSVSPTVTDEDANTTKVLEWEWTPANLADESGTNPYDDARAHRGQIRGDFLIVGYSYTPNWAAARIANDKYDFYVRRSFDGGKTWTKADGNTSEGPVNVSNLANNKETVIEPRLVATPGTILVDGEVVDPMDKQNKNIYFITYGTAENIPNVVGSVDDDTDVSAGAPLDLYYARTTDRGETYEMVEQTITSEDSNLTGETIAVMDWFAHSGAEEGEVQIRMTPDGTVFYGSWIQESEMDNEDIPDHFKGSDIWFRKVDYNLLEEEAETVE